MPAVRSKYDGLLASFYDLDHSWRNYKLQSKFLKSLYPHPRLNGPFSVLDICCGSGSHSLAMADQRFRVTGIDVSDELLKQARKKHSSNSSYVSFMKKDVFSLGRFRSFHSKFSGAFLFGWTVAMTPIFDRFSKLLETMDQILKPGGIFAFDVPIGPSYHVPNAPLHYQVSRLLKGTLRIKEQRNVRKNLCVFHYDWEIQKRESVRDRFLKTRLQARETLRILEPANILPVIKKMKDRFKILTRVRDYSLKMPYRNGDKNMIVVLQKYV